MKKKNILQKNRDYNRIIKKYKPYRYKYLSFYIERTIESNYFFGFSIGKKLGNAVKRNKIKRQLKSIIDKNDYQNGFNCIIMVNSGIMLKPFQEIKIDVENAINNLNILK